MTGEAIFALIGVGLGIALGYWAARLARISEDKQQARGLLAAIRTDIERGTECLNAYESIINGSPTWRLRTSTWRAALPFLAGLQALTAQEIATICQFFDLADEFNYCLDCVASADPASKDPERKRALHKAKRATKTDAEAAEPLTARAISAVAAALARIG